jgi:hypothetical protein
MAAWMVAMAITSIEEADREAATLDHVGVARARKPEGELLRGWAVKVLSGRGPRPAM